LILEKDQLVIKKKSFESSNSDFRAHIVSLKNKKNDIKSEISDLIDSKNSLKNLVNSYDLNKSSKYYRCTNYNYMNNFSSCRNDYLVKSDKDTLLEEIIKLNDIISEYDSEYDELSELILEAENEKSLFENLILSINDNV